MDVFDAIKARQSIRKYKTQPIPTEKLEAILEAARLAPSAGNRQPWRFIIIQDPERKKALAEAANDQTFLENAAAIVTAVGDPDLSARWFEKDTMIALEHMVLAATALGYGTCWIGAFNEDTVKTLLKIPQKAKVVALLPIGTPDETPAARPRKKTSEVFAKEDWQTPWPPYENLEPRS